MGTSRYFAGASNHSALIPACAYEDEGDDIAPRPDDENNANGAEIPEESNRFTAARTALTGWVLAGAETPAPRFAGRRLSRADRQNSGGTALRRSLGRYARHSLGGRASAARRMRKASRAAASTISVLQAISQRGISAVLIELRLDALAGRPIREIFAAIADTVIGSIESIDDDLARQAMLDTLLVVPDDHLIDFEHLTEEQVVFFYTEFVCKAIERRYLADVSASGRLRAASDRVYIDLDKNVGQFIALAVRAQVNEALNQRLTLDAGFTEGMMQEVFQAAWSVLESYDND